MVEKSGNKVSAGCPVSLAKLQSQEEHGAKNPMFPWAGAVAYCLLALLTGGKRS